ncbi:SDR family NAD(P)-dependent oxidoreductase [Pedobacter chinensis]|uniref:SDR family NAD(P)-dependent oxidoreductase n=1 Tax=Pedobacter chinensis TaxID=2282421 RepID=A0A369PTJ7_9SPHI|nr:NmrA family NAD(P)-binding protein [Pedobacter chinensis]RDC55854.1 SDR family NAD(P)-dependent oxidoreductase [Pedobacter chinensis]
MKKRVLVLPSGDYNDLASLQEATKGIDTLILVSGNDLEHRANQHVRVIRAAKENGVKKIIYYSLQRKDDQPDGGLLGNKTVAHYITENALIASGMIYVILQVSLYTDMIPQYAGQQIQQTKTIYLPAEDGKVAYALRSELGEAGAIIALDETGKYDNKFIELTGSEAISWTTIATMISAITGDKYKYVSPEVNEFLETMKTNGTPAWMGPALKEMQQAVAHGEFTKVTDDLESILGRKPETVMNFLITVYSKS